MAKAQTRPNEGGSYSRDPKTGKLNRRTFTEQPDQAAVQAAERAAAKAPAPEPKEDN